MTISDARLAANRSNSLRSTGPRTEEGKARSRGNAYKHGMTGEGVGIPDSEAVAVDRRAGDLRAAVAVPALGRRIAVLARRLDRLALHEEATAERLARNAEATFDEDRQDRVDALVRRLEEDPAVSVRGLRRTPEGCDRLLALWEDLARNLALGVLWDEAHTLRVENLTGRRPGDLGISRVGALSGAFRGDFRYLPPAPELDGLELGPRNRIRRDAASAELVGLVADQIAGLRAHRDTLPVGAIALDRAGAADRAMFDTSPEGVLFRRYELATERGLYKALREVEAAGSPEEPPPAVPLAGGEGEGRDHASGQGPSPVAGAPAGPVGPDSPALGSFGAGVPGGPVAPPADSSPNEISVGARAAVVDGPPRDYAGGAGRVGPDPVGRARRPPPVAGP